MRPGRPGVSLLEAPMALTPVTPPVNPRSPSGGGSSAESRRSEPNRAAAADSEPPRSSPAFDASLASGTFKTSTGLNTIGGDLLLAAGKIFAVNAPQTLSGAGAVNVTTVVTLFTSTGAAQALTLGDGARTGQLKIICHVVDGGSAMV